MQFVNLVIFVELLEKLCLKIPVNFKKTNKMFKYHFHNFTTA